jgi:hypothetical protein
LGRADRRECTKPVETAGSGKPTKAGALRVRAFDRDLRRANGIMASGIWKGRIKRPNTWPHRPAMCRSFRKSLPTWGRPHTALHAHSHQPGTSCGKGRLHQRRPQTAGSCLGRGPCLLRRDAWQDHTANFGESEWHRGPFIAGRIIDLSARAAAALGLSSGRCAFLA